MNCARCDRRPDQSDDLSYPEQLAGHAILAEHWLCSCGRSLTNTEPRTCERCLSDFRSSLADILLLWQELPRHLRTVAGTALGGSRSGADGPALPGGQVLALLGPGSPGSAARRLTRTDRQRGETGREHSTDNRPGDTPSVAWTLGNIEDDWRHTRGDDPAMTGTSTSAIIQGAGRYLEVHARWAANHHEAFHDCLTELRDLRLLLETATNRLRRPARANARCFECGGDLIRRVIDGLEEDAVTCRDCREQYDPRRYALALKAAAERASQYETDGESWATPAVMATELQRSEHTIRSWAQRDLVRHHTRAGVLFVNATDTRSRHDQTPQRRTA